MLPPERYVGDGAGLGRAGTVSFASSFPDLVGLTASTLAQFYDALTSHPAHIYAALASSSLLAFTAIREPEGHPRVLGLASSLFGHGASKPTHHYTLTIIIVPFNRAPRALISRPIVLRAPGQHGGPSSGSDFLLR